MTKEEKIQRDRAWQIANAEHLKKYRKNYYLKNKERKKEKIREWKQKNKTRVKAYNKNLWLKTKYGISLDEYNRIFTIQNGRCAICDKPSADYKRSLHVDHNHSDGKIRGLLCVNCNNGVGCFQDNPELLSKAKLYLEK